jgi:Copper transport outer membrane protein, MctB
MVTFRFYLVSLVAVFLALAMGVVVGSTLIDRAIVDRLDRSVESVSDRLDRQRDENAELREELQQLRDYADGTAASVVDGALDGGAVAVVAERGVDAEVVESAVAMLQQAEGTAPGILWLEPSWALAEEGDRTRLAEVLDVPETGPGRLRDRAWGRLVTALQGGSVQGDPLQDLAEGGFVTYQDVGEVESGVGVLAGVGEQVVLVSGPRSQLAPELTLSLGQGLVQAGVPSVVAEAWDEQEDGPARGTVAGLVRDQDELADAVSTVDDLDLVQGRVAATLALADLRNGVRGHYGYGSDADRPLPERPPA